MVGQDCTEYVHFWHVFGIRIGIRGISAEYGQNTHLSESYGIRILRIYHVGLYGKLRALPAWQQLMVSHTTQRPTRTHLVPKHRWSTP